MGVVTGLFKVALYFGGASLAFAGLVSLVTWAGDPARQESELPQGPHVVEGLAVAGPVVASPVGEPFLLGRVAVTCDGVGYRKLVNEYRGSRTLSITGDAGVTMVTLAGPDPARTWYGRFDESREGLIEAEARKLVGGDWQAGECALFSVSVIAIRPNDSLLIERDATGSVIGVGLGSRRELRRVAHEKHFEKPVTYILAALIAAFGGAVSLLGLLGLAVVRLRRAGARSGED